MLLKINPGNKLIGEVSLPGDKSISIRFALFALLAQGESRAKNFLTSGITKTILKALSDIEIEWRLENDNLLVVGKGIDGIHAPRKPIYCGNSATALRLLAGVFAAAGIQAILDGSPSLRQRPMQRIIEPLQALGVEINLSKDGLLPIFLVARQPRKYLNSTDIRLEVASAQVKTCVLIASLACSGEVTIQEPSQSRDHSERMLKQMGVIINRINDDNYSSIRINPIGKTPLTPLVINIPGDFSAAAFFIVAGLITPESKILIRNVGLNPTRIGLLSALREMGAKISVINYNEQATEPFGDLLVFFSQLHGINISGNRVVQMIDEFPIIGIAAAYAKGITTVVEAEELRYKESDRISVLCKTLRELGVQVQEKRDGFTINGNGKLKGGITIDPEVDHRNAMAFAIAGLAAESPIEIKNPEIIDESFPDFLLTLKSLGADIVLCN